MGIYISWFMLAAFAYPLLGQIPRVFFDPPAFITTITTYVFPVLEIWIATCLGLAVLSYLLRVMTKV
jgi:hypothetical protein